MMVGYDGSNSGTMLFYEKLDFVQRNPISRSAFLAVQTDIAGSCILFQIYILDFSLSVFLDMDCLPVLTVIGNFNFIICAVSFPEKNDAGKGFRLSQVKPDPLRSLCWEPQRL